MNAEHLPADVPTVFESLDDEGVRTAGTTYLMYRGRHEHQISRETRADPARLDASCAARSWARRELFYADIFASRETGCRSQLGLPGVRDQHAGCVGAVPRRARPLRLPAALAARQRHALAQQRPARAGHVDRERRPPARAHVPRRRRRRRVPRRARGDRRRRPLARAGRAAHRARRRLRRVPPPAAERRGPRRGRDRAVPGAALGDGLRAAARGRATSSSRSSSTPRAALEGVDLVMWRPAPREGAIRGAARRAALRPGRRPARRARRALVGRRAARGPRRRRRATASSAAPTYPDALARVWAALDLRDLRRRPAVGRARAGSSPTGAGSTTSAAAATARCTAATRSARSRSAASRRPTRTACGAGRSRDVAPMIRAHFGPRAG